MKNYCIEVAYNLVDLNRQVNEMVKIGYCPIGGITLKQRPELDFQGKQWEYMQAMLIEEESK